MFLGQMKGAVMSAAMISIVACCLMLAIATILVIKKKRLHIWLWAYIAQQLKQVFSPLSPQGTVHILFCLVDHFEPISKASSTAE